MMDMEAIPGKHRKEWTVHTVEPTFKIGIVLVLGVGYISCSLVVCNVLYPLIIDQIPGQPARLIAGGGLVAEEGISLGLEVPPNASRQGETVQEVFMFAATEFVSGDEATIVHVFAHLPDHVTELWSAKVPGIVSGVTFIDMNDDLLPELAVSTRTGTSSGRTFGENALRIYEIQSGTYQLVARRTGDQSITRLRMIDHDGDGKESLLVPFDRWLKLMERDAGGISIVAELYSHGSYSLDVGDVNHDGKIDIVHAAPNAWQVEVLENKGEGTFSTRIIGGRNQTPYYIDGLETGDVDGDGLNEIVMVGCCGETPPDSTISVYEYAEGQYRLVSTYHGFTIQSVAVADLDGDGAGEIVTSSDTSATQYGQHGVSVWKRNHQNGTFYRAWEDLETRFSPDGGLAITGMLCLAAIPTPQGGRSTVVGIGSRKLDGVRTACLYLLQRWNDEYQTMSLPLWQGNTMYLHLDAYPISNMPIPIPEQTIPALVLSAGMWLALHRNRRGLDH